MIRSSDCDSIQNSSGAGVIKHALDDDKVTDDAIRMDSTNTDEDTSKSSVDGVENDRSEASAERSQSRGSITDEEIGHSPSHETRDHTTTENSNTVRRERRYLSESETDTRSPVQVASSNEDGVSVQNEDSMCSVDSDRQVTLKTNLYGTDIDSRYDEDSCPDLVSQFKTQRLQHQSSELDDRSTTPVEHTHLPAQESSSDRALEPGSEYIIPSGYKNTVTTEDENRSKQGSDAVRSAKSGAPTNFSGFLGQQTSTRSVEGNIDPNMTDVTVFRNSYLNGYDAPTYISRSPEGMKAGAEVCDGTAERLASELVQTYGGNNSHKISDILKRGEERPGYPGYGHYERNLPTDGRTYEQYQSSQLVHGAADIPGHPQMQVPCGDNEYQRQPSFHPHHPRDLGPSYHKVHHQPFPGHNEQWAFKRPLPYQHSMEHMQVPNPNKNFDVHQHRGSIAPLGKSSPSGQNHQMSMSAAGFNNMQQYSTEHGNGNKDQRQHSTGISSLMEMPLGSPRTVHDVTKMTFTSREMMETHLSQSGQLKSSSFTDVLGSPVSDMNYSSIYPPREFIERASQGEHPLPPIPHQALPGSKSVYDTNPPPKKRLKSSGYLDAPSPALPVLDDMMVPKYPPVLPKDANPHPSRQKYFVFNPSEVTQMSSKMLLMKYIDFLVLENEQITEISKCTAPPEDIYVTEDMYFMDTLKYNVPFPSPKFAEWVSSFYPKLGFEGMKFKGRHPKQQQSGLYGSNKVKDGRPTQEILEDTFYFFQREIMRKEEGDCIP